MSFIDDFVVVFPHETRPILKPQYIHYSVIRRILTAEFTSSHPVISIIPNDIIHISTDYRTTTCKCDTPTIDNIKSPAVKIFIPMQFVYKIRSLFKPNEAIMDLDVNSDGIWIGLYKINPTTNSLNPVHESDLNECQLNISDSKIHVTCNMHLECTELSNHVYYIRAVLL